MKTPSKPNQNSTKRAKPARKQGSKRKKAAFKPTLPPQPGTKAFYELQMQWYAKLKAETGFADLEVQANTGSGNDLPRLFGQSMHSLGTREQKLGSATTHYFTMWSCWLAYADLHKLVLEYNDRRRPSIMTAEQLREALELFSVGTPARTIGLMMSAKYKGASYEVIRRWVKRLWPIVRMWNKVDPNGLDFEPDIE